MILWIDGCQVNAGEVGFSYQPGVEPTHLGVATYERDELHARLADIFRRLEREAVEDREAGEAIEAAIAAVVAESQSGELSDDSVEYLLTEWPYCLDTCNELFDSKMSPKTRWWVTSVVSLVPLAERRVAVILRVVAGTDPKEVVAAT